MDSCIDKIEQCDDNDQSHLRSSNSDCGSPSKSRYGRMLKPKIVQDFYNFDHVDVIDDNGEQVNGKNDKKLNCFNGNNGSIIKDLVDNNCKVNGENTEIIDGNNQKELENEDTAKVVKLITKSSILTVDNLEKSNKANNLKTYTNKRKHFHDNCKIESFGLPDEPIIPITNSLKSNHDTLQLNIAELPDLWSDDNCRRNTRSNSSKIINCHQEDEKQTAEERSSTIIREILDEFIENLDLSQKSIDDCKIGDLVWAKLGSHPYWPCLVVKNPQFKTYKRPLYTKKTIYYHVRFFADNGRGAWINPKDLRYYKKKDNFVKLHNVKIKPNKLKLLEKAIEEAEFLSGKSVEERLKFFDEILEKSINNRRSSSVNGSFTRGVCRICRKSGDIQRCKGPCNGIFHKDCILTSNSDITNAQKSNNGTNVIEKSNDGTFDEFCCNYCRLNQSPPCRICNRNDNNRRNSSSKRRANDSITTPKLKRFKRNSCSSTIGKVEKIEENFPKLQSIPTTLEEQEILYRRNNLFRGISKEKVCQICEKSGDIQRCKGPCNGIFHKDCVEKLNNDTINIQKSNYDTTIAQKLNNGTTNNVQKSNNGTIILDEFCCNYCRLNQPSPCLVCNRIDNNDNNDNNNDNTGTLPQKCSLSNCGQFYHLDCLKLWQQTQWTSIYSKNDNTFICPQHICHICSSEDPHLSQSRCSNQQIVKCLKCPATYHMANYCIPAGTIILTTTQIICPRHFNNNSIGDNNNNNNSDNRRIDRFSQTINANWCFICSKGGDLICCETCPTCVHIECLPPNHYNHNNNNHYSDIFFCEDCQSGRLPLYDEVVWVKLGSFRWWPAIILFPNEIPQNVQKFKHKIGDFVVKFFGTYDHYWVTRGRTFLFHEDDNKGEIKVKKHIDNVFKRAVEEALNVHKLKKQFRLNIMMERNFRLKPPHYIRIKVNKPVGNVRLFDGNTSNPTSCDCDPNQQFPCGPDSNCLNRLLLTECNPEACPAGQRCCNQCFEKREYPPLLPYKTQTRGWGLKTLIPIQQGQFIIEYVGEMIDEQEYQRRIKKMHEQKVENYYFLTIDNYRILDAGPKGNVARFMNHSCQPNCITQKWTVNGDTRVGLFATCSIPAGTELTFNYNLECIGDEKKECKCGASNCSGFIGVKATKNEEIINEPKKVQRKKRGRKRKIVVVKNRTEDIENLCFICRQNGDVYPCSNKVCTKFYHLNCIGLKTWPTGGKWLCSWHNCNICTKRTIRCCFDCLNSYCPTHSDRNIRYDKFLGFVCKQHDPLINDKILSTADTKENEDDCLTVVKNIIEESLDLVINSNSNNKKLKKT